MKVGRSVLALAASGLVACSGRAAQPARTAPPSTPAPSPTAASAVRLCELQDGRITEASGLAASDLQDDVLFTHDDSGDAARFFALGTDCRTRATYVLDGVDATDVEDVARGPGRVLWLGDIGDNAMSRKAVRVYRVDEPTVPTTGAPTVHLQATVSTLTYPDGPHDAETLLADPADGRLYVLTKSLVGASGLYAAPLPLGTTGTLERVASVTFTATRLGSPETVARQLAATAGDVSPDGTRVVLRTYDAAYVRTVAASADGRPRLAATFADGRPGTRVPLPSEQQGEAVAWSADGRSLFLTSEGTGAPLDRVDLG